MSHRHDLPTLLRACRTAAPLALAALMGALGMLAVIARGVEA